MTGKSSKSLRLDQLLVDRGLVENVKLAASLIMAGEVTVADQRVDKPGHKVSAEAAVRLKARGQYVSRGGDKLAHLIKSLGLEAKFQGAALLDVGSSTGGFTDCALQHGAVRATAVDVGTNQLDWSLKKDPRVSSFEKTDITNFVDPVSEPYDLVVADISFNSVSYLLPSIVRAGGPKALYMILVKPQFEAGIHEIPEGGVVSDTAVHAKVLKDARDAFEKNGLKIAHEVPCGVKGRSGNQEYFLVASFSF